MASSRPAFSGFPSVFSLSLLLSPPRSLSLHCVPRELWSARRRALGAPEMCFLHAKINQFNSIQCAQPYKGAIKAPLNQDWNKEELAKAPDIDLQLDYVFGYRAKDQNNNIKYLKSGNIVYHVAALGVILDIKQNKQRFFNGHKDDIISISVCSDGVRVATGEVGAKPTIYIWDSNTLEVLNVFKGILRRGVDLISWNLSGNLIAATGLDDDHTITLYDTTNHISKGGSLLLDQKGGREVFTALEFKNDTVISTLSLSLSLRK